MKKCDTLFRAGQTDIYLKRKSELEAAACIKGTSSICVGSVGAEMYLAELCICSVHTTFWLGGLKGGDH
jgi:hypothetical protein